MAAAGLLIAIAALLREESRGGHFRSDFPGRSHRARRLSLRLGQSDVVTRLMPADSAAIAVGV
jgi:L-aspartate oxidase